MKKLVLSFALLLLTGIGAFAQDGIGILDMPKERPTETPQATKKITVIFVCDRSGSMEDYDKIDELNSALETLFGDLVKDPQLASSLQVGVVDFASGVRVSRQPGPLGIMAKAPAFRANGGTNMSDALRKAYKLASHVPSDQLKPIVILMTDGEPDSKSSTERSAEQLRQAAHFYSLGVSGADFTFLDNISAGQTAALKGTQFKSFFKDMTDALNYHIMAAQEDGTAPKTFSIQNKSGWKLD